MFEPISDACLHLSHSGLYQLQFYLGLKGRFIVKWLLKIQELRMNWILLAVGDVVE